MIYIYLYIHIYNLSILVIVGVTVLEYFGFLADGAFTFPAAVTSYIFHLKQGYWKSH